MRKITIPFSKRWICFISSIFLLHNSKMFISQSLFLISTLHNKIFISVDFESKNFDRKLAENRKNRPKFFGSKSTEIKILLCKVDIRKKLYENFFFELCSKKMKFMKQIHLFIKCFVIFLKGATFSDFIETGLWNYIHSNPLSAIMEDFLSIRFKPHQVVRSLWYTYAVDWIY